MQSMTGFARAEKSLDRRTVCVEIKSVNNRFLETCVKLPRCLNFLEDAVRKLLAASLARGRVDVYITYSDLNEQSKGVTIDTALAQSLVKISGELAALLHIQDTYSTTELMKNQDVVIVTQAAGDEDELKDLVLSTVSAAVERLREMRGTEGENLKNDLAQKFSAIEKIRRDLLRIAPEALAVHRERLTERIREFTSGKVDEQRMITELALYADKSCVDEELTRLKSHLDQSTKLLNEKGAVGRRLDFLVQELNREANTVCSKSSSAEMTKLGVDLKCEIEKIREQIQNIE